MDRDIREAIDNAVSSFVEHVLWHLSEETLDRDRARDLIADSDWNDAVAIGLTLDQQLEAIEEGVEEGALEAPSFDTTNLRSSIESNAAVAIYRLAESRASVLFEDLFDLMDEHGLEPEQMRDANPLGWMAHRAERDEGSNCTVYEYRNVEEPGRHINVWEVRLSSGDRVWLLGEPNQEA